MTDPDAMLSPEEREAKERKLELDRLAGREGQAQEYREALKLALNTVNLELSGQGVKPRIDAVVQALTMLQAEFIGMYPERRERRMRIAELESNLKRLVTLHASTGARPAKPLGELDG